MNNDHEFHELNELTMQNDMIMTNLTNAFSDLKVLSLRVWRSLCESVALQCNAFVKFVINMVSVRTPKIRIIREIRG
jgi:hypothetical protein